jgi:phospholipid/cholesterol/gamma-HCH transport system permease protein
MSSKSRSIFQALGDGGSKLLDDFRDLMLFTGEIGAALFYAAKNPRKIKWRDTFYYMDVSGSDALPIICLLGFLVGVILAFQAVVQLSRFGVNSYVVDLVGATIVRELGPLMVAIVIAGRSGSAFASEIGTMKVSQEIDAMVTMGFVPSRFIIVPKVLALLIIMPMLTIFADIFGIIGGMTVALVKVGISLRESFYKTLDVVTPCDLVQGLVKSVVFAAIIACIGCMRGFESGNDAQGVGRASTSAVVSSIFLVIIADALITSLFSLN